MSPRKATCAGCPAIVSEDGPFMRCSRCKNIFDIFCANFDANTFSTLSLEFKKTWMCVECLSKLPRGDNSHTPVRQHHALEIKTKTKDRSNVTIGSPDNVTMRTAARQAQVSSPGTGQSGLRDFKDTVIQELKNLQLDFELQLTSKINDLIVGEFQSFKAEIFGKIDALTSKVLQLEEQYKTEAGKANNNTSITTGQSTTTSTTKKNKAPKQKGQAQSKPIGGIITSSNIPAQNNNKTTEELLPSSNPNSENVTKGDWEEVRPRRARASLASVRRGTAAPGTTLLQASERWTYLHLYYVQEGTSTEQVRNHLSTICSGDVCTVDELKSRGRYASFKLGVPARCADSVLSSANWAQDICIKPWRQNFRTQEKRTQQL